jgi:hypothetical protein
MSYVREVRRDVVDQLHDLRRGQPRKYQLVVEQIIKVVENAPLDEPAGPDDL